MKLLISAAEVSSDVHGAALLRSLRKLHTSGENLEVIGIGGPHLREAGLNPVVDSRELLVMGFTETLGSLPRIYRAYRKLIQAARTLRPDVAILIDYPEFHFRVAKQLRKMGIPAVYYIPPKVWVWRQKRAYFLKKHFRKLLCIFPFEEAYYSRLNIPASYVGNPLLDELPIQMSRKIAREALGLGEEDRVCVLMPGSRPSELEHHLCLMLEAAQRAVPALRAKGELATGSKLQALIPLPIGQAIQPITQAIQRQAGGFPDLTIRIEQGKAPECLKAADAGLIKSGTSTLEAGLMRCPHAVVYKPTATTRWIFQNIIRYKGPVGMVNLMADEKFVREILCEEVTPEVLSQELVSLFCDEEKRQALQSGFSALLRRIYPGGRATSPSDLAAQEVLSLCS